MLKIILKKTNNYYYLVNQSNSVKVKSKTCTS